MRAHERMPKKWFNCCFWRKGYSRKKKKKKKKAVVGANKLSIFFRGDLLAG